MRKILFLLVVAFFAFQLACFASINITGLAGTIKITPPGGGTPITIKAGQPIPAIANGSTIEIMAGMVTVATTAPSTVNLFARGNTIVMGAGNTVQVTLNVNGATKVSDSKGSAFVKTSDGKSTSLRPGQTIIIAGNVVTNAEAYTPPIGNPGGVNTQVQYDDSRKDYIPPIISQDNTNQDTSPTNP